MNQNERLIKNMEEYDKKEKAREQESKVLGSKPAKRKANKGKKTPMHNS